MKRIKNIVLMLLVAVPMVVMISGCTKFLDRKPLTATMDDLHSYEKNKKYNFNVACSSTHGGYGFRLYQIPGSQTANCDNGRSSSGSLGIAELWIV